MTEDLHRLVEDFTSLVCGLCPSVYMPVGEGRAQCWKSAASWKTHEQSLGFKLGQPPALSRDQACRVATRLHGVLPGASSWTRIGFRKALDLSMTVT